MSMPRGEKMKGGGEAEDGDETVGEETDWWGVGGKSK